MLFLIQLYVSVTYYLTWPVAVDVQINYNNSIIFPAVTICNMNAFRLRAVNEHGLVHVVNHMFNALHKHHNIGPDAPTFSMEELYRKSAHRPENLIVGCSWNGLACSFEDFQPILTDEGLCYTYNNVHGNQTKFATRKGTHGGLSLHLNIEQYEYMHGPNEGAGLRILLHPQGDVPLVKEQGLAVAPGFHASVGVTALQIRNLPPPRGVCNDSVTARFFEGVYTKTKCAVECRMRRLLKVCGCRDIYMMKGENITDMAVFGPVCDNHVYSECLQQFNRNHSDGDCACPVPCFKLTYQTLMTRASSSNFDISSLLKNQTRVQHLQRHLVEAKETGLKLELAQDSSMKEAIFSVLKATTEIQERLSSLKTAIKRAKHDLYSYMSDMRSRIGFYWDRGITSVRYVVKHNFVRGWDVYDERIFSQATLHCLELTSRVRITFETAKKLNNLNSSLAGLNDSDTSADQSNIASQCVSKTGQSVLKSVKALLRARIQTVEQAQEKINKTYRAYTNGKRLLKFWVTPGRRYDLTYISPKFLQIGSSAFDTDSYFTEMKELGTDKLKNGLGILVQTLDSLTMNESCNFFPDFLLGKTLTEYGCKKFYFYLFLLKDRYVMAPLDEINERVERFEKLNATLYRVFHDYAMRRLLLAEQEILVFESQLRTTVLRVRDLLDMYVRYGNITFTDLAVFGTSVNFSTSYNSFNAFEKNYRLQYNDFFGSLQSVQNLLKAMWKSMLSEPTVDKFYDKILEDVQDFFHDPDKYDFYMDIFSRMLRMNETVLRSMDKDSVASLMTWNRSLLTIEEVADSVDNLARPIAKMLHPDAIFGKFAENLTDPVAQLLGLFKSFTKSTQVDAKFYRENFLRLDVFMQDLTYESIRQHEAYDIYLLLSDIGGSMGLFIGGSVLSAFELLDFFLYNVFLRVFK